MYETTSNKIQEIINMSNKLITDCIDSPDDKTLLKASLNIIDNCIKKLAEEINNSREYTLKEIENYNERVQRKFDKIKEIVGIDF